MGQNNVKLRGVDPRSAHELGMVSIFLSSWEKIRRRTIFHDVRINEFHFSGSTNNYYNKATFFALHIICVCFGGSRQSSVTGTEIVCPTKLLRLATWPFAENVCLPLFSMTIHS